MRVIKFRGIDEYTGAWVYGNYCRAELLNGKGYEDFIIETSEKGCTHKVKPDTIGQYICLHDNVGAEAYEGDVTEDIFNRRWVIFGAPGGFGVCRIAEYVSGHKLQFYEELGGLTNSSRFMRNHRIIGNIHENMDLLGG